MRVELASAARQAIHLRGREGDNGMADLYSTVALLSLACNEIENPKLSLGSIKNPVPAGTQTFDSAGSFKVDVTNQRDSPAEDKQQKSRDFTTFVVSQH